MMLNWKWNNMSDPKIPSRNIKWSWGIPYCISVDGSLFWKGFSFGVWTPLMGLSFISNVFCGKSVRMGFQQWFLYITCNHGWSASVYFGYSRLKHLEMQIRRMMKQPKQRE